MALFGGGVNDKVLRRRLILWDPMPAAQLFAFYLGIPLLMATLFGLNHAGLARHFTIAQGVPYWIGIWVPVWLLLEAATRGSAFLLRPLSPPLWVVLLIGSTIAGLASGPYVGWYVAQFRDWLPAGTPSSVPTLPGAWRELDLALAFAALPLFWLTINYYYDRVLGVPRYRGRLMELNPEVGSGTGVGVGGGASGNAVGGAGSAAGDHALPGTDDGQQVGGPASAERAAMPSPATRLQAANGDATLPLPEPAATAAPASGAVADSALIALLPAKVGTEVLALHAEDHYVRVYTRLGSALVRYRFGDAMRDLEPLDGMQVHRSFWVRRTAVVAIDTQVNPWLITIDGGQQIPVSQAFRAAVKGTFSRSAVSRS